MAKLLKSSAFLRIARTLRIRLALFLVVSSSTSIAFASAFSPGPAAATRFALGALSPLSTESPDKFTDWRDLLRNNEEWAHLQVDEDRLSLTALAESYAEYSYIPYIWGGSNFGEKSVCEECRSCLAKRKHYRVAGREKSCSACKQCGMDCSHFVNHVYKEAGYEFPFLSTADMRRLASSDLKEKYSLVDIGRDLSSAEPGDLLVHPKHVTMLLRRSTGERGDFIHVTRSTHGDRLGGIEVKMDAELAQFRSPILRILRHAQLHDRFTEKSVNRRANAESTIKKKRKAKSQRSKKLT